MDDVMGASLRLFKRWLKKFPEEVWYVGELVQLARPILCDNATTNPSMAFRVDEVAVGIEEAIIDLPNHSKLNSAFGGTYSGKLDPDRLPPPELKILQNVNQFVLQLIVRSTS